MADIIPHDQGGGDLFRVAEVFAASGMFPDHRDAAQCAAKLIVGQGLGLTPYDSMNGLHIIQGKAVLAANTMAAAIKRSGRYDYRAVTDDEACEITFYDVTIKDENGRPSIIGTTTFTMDDAKRAGLGGQNWKKYPRAMLFARAISAGYREHCPDALGAAPVYVEQHGETEIPRPPTTGGKNAPPSLPEPEGNPINQLRDLINDREDADDIETMLLDRGGVDDLAELTLDQIRKAIEWLKK